MLAGLTGENMTDATQTTGPARPPEGLTYCSHCQSDMLAEYPRVNANSLGNLHRVTTVMVDGTQLLHAVEVGHGWWAESVPMGTIIDGEMLYDPPRCPCCLTGLLSTIRHGPVALVIEMHDEQQAVRL